MPTLDEILDDKIQRLESVPSNLVDGASKAQIELLNKAKSLVGKMDIVDGNFVFNDKNIALIEEIGTTLQGTLNESEYVSDLTTFAKEFNTQGSINNEFFTKISQDFESKSVYKAVLKQSQKNAVDLLSIDAITAEVINPIKSSILSGVVNEGSFTETLKTLTDLTTNVKGTDGILTRYVKRVAYDSFAVADRQYTQAIAADLNFKFFKFRGGHIADTRCFCDERLGGYYHIDEIQDWGRGKHVGACGYPWQGMNKNTNSDTIFSYVGGYNCKHGFIPYLTSEVPPKWIKRAKSLGYL
jgi:hypothetical protein